MKLYKADLARLETKLITAYQELICERIELGWQCSLLTFTFVPLPGNRALPPSLIGKNLERFYSLVLTRLIHHPKRSSSVLPSMLGMPDLPVFKQTKVKAKVTVNDGLHAHAIFLAPPNTRQARTLAWVLEAYSDLILDYCHLMAVHSENIGATPEKATAYTLKSLDLCRFDGDSIWIFPFARSETNSACRSIGEDQTHLVQLRAI